VPPQSRSALIIGAGVAGPVLALFLGRTGLSVQLFEGSGRPADTGGALALAPNGMNVLAAAGVVDQVRDVSVTANEFALENQRGKILACMPAGDPSRYEQVSVMITRAALHRVLVEHAEGEGVEVHYDKIWSKLKTGPADPLLCSSRTAPLLKETFWLGPTASARKSVRRPCPRRPSRYIPA
jgi:2-polyprenyl-6-methoxyphenol hydroxylase-like FAD-dependent oxidoreductase